MMTWYTLHIDDAHTYATTIYPTRTRALRERQAHGFIGTDDDVEDMLGNRALITAHDVPFSEVLLLSLVIAAFGVLGILIGVTSLIH